MLNADAITATLLNAFGETVTYAPRYGTVSVIKAIRTVHSIDNALDHQGIGPQTVTFDIASLNTPRPAKDDRITDASGVDWFVKQVPHLAYEGQWRVTVEKQR